MNKIADRYISDIVIRCAKELNLSSWDLEGLALGLPTTLYHGTTRSFKKFNIGMSRDELVDKYYGAGIFLTPSKRVAESYANSNRNIGVDPSIISELKSKNRKAGDFMELMYKVGNDIWDMYSREALGLGPDDDYVEAITKVTGGVDPNLIADLCGWIIGSKKTPVGSNDDALSLFSQTTGAPSWIYDTMDEVGVDSNEYRPKVYTVVVTVSNPLVTNSKPRARSAKSKGFDSVVYYGQGIVSGVPEVAVYNANDVKITNVTVVD